MHLSFILPIEQKEYQVTFKSERDDKSSPILGKLKFSKDLIRSYNFELYKNILSGKIKECYLEIDIISWEVRYYFNNRL